MKEMELMSTPALTVVEFYRSLRSLGFRFEETATEGTIVRGLRHITNRAFWAEARMLPANTRWPSTRPGARAAAYLATTRSTNSVLGCDAPASLSNRTREV